MDWIEIILMKYAVPENYSEISTKNLKGPVGMFPLSIQLG